MNHGFAHQTFLRGEDGGLIVTFTCVCGVIIGPLSPDQIAERWTSHLQERIEALESA